MDVHMVLAHLHLMSAVAPPRSSSKVVVLVPAIHLEDVDPNSILNVRFVANLGTLLSHVGILLGYTASLSCLETSSNMD
ncbi:hypothetical protein M5K25_000042 [Dendrobium thyrsiflorum]|uniref:Uncharacterized protein n=1 Tax=Dendrobium thyrsiflorum TaxID=117978 RepID=A0ABD0VUE9_DENTH